MSPGIVFLMISRVQPYCCVYWINNTEEDTKCGGRVTELSMVGEGPMGVPCVCLGCLQFDWVNIALMA